MRMNTKSGADSNTDSVMESATEESTIEGLKDNRTKDATRVSRHKIYETKGNSDFRSEDGCNLQAVRSE